jgi:hypothetical protein
MQPKLFRLILILAAALLPAWVSANGLECKTPKGDRCVCATSKPTKCAHAAKGICRSGRVVEVAAGNLHTAYENNVEIFKECRVLGGGIKEIVFNDPIVDSARYPEPTRSTASTGQ